MQITVDFDMREISLWTVTLPEKQVAKAKVRALNKAADQGKTQMVREITAEYALTAGFVRERINVKRASATAKRFVMQASVQATERKRSMNMIAFAEKVVTLAQMRKRVKAGEGGTHTLKGGGVVHKALELRFKIKRVGAKKIVKGAFLGNKGRTVFIRSGDERLPIEALQTINVAQMFNTKRVNARVVAKIKSVLPGLMNHELSYELSR